MVSKAFEIDLGRIQKRAMDAVEAKAEQDRQAEQARTDAEAARKDAIRAKQTELNVALGDAGLSLIAVDGIDGPQTRQAVIDVAALDDDTGDDTGDGIGDNDPLKPNIELLEGESWVKVGNKWLIEVQTETGSTRFAPSELVNMRESGYLSGQFNTFPRKETPAQRAQQLALEQAQAQKQANWDEHLRTLSAKGSITDYFKSFGLENISEWAYAQLASGYDVETVLMQMRYGSSTVTVDNDMYVPEIVRTTYDTRFPAMTLRDADDKTAPLTEAEYIDLETGYWQIIDAAGMGAYADAAIKNGLDLISNMIVGDVSLAEFQGRIGEAEEMAFNTNLEVQAALQDNWGWGKGEFITAMFDPDSITLKDAKRRRRSSMLSGTAHRALGGTAGGSELAFSKQLGLDLLGLNIQDREVQAQMAPLTGLTGSTLHSDALSADQLGEGVWGSGKARAALGREVGGRTAGFRGKSGGLTTEAGIRSYGSAGT
jgi:hypothetical protein